MQKKMLQQMIQFNKTAFENTFKILMALEDQMERNVNTYMEQSAGLPEEWKKALGEWIEVYKKGCEDCHQSVEESFKKVEMLFTAKK